MFIFDGRDLRFREVNRAASKLYGWSRAEFLRMTVLDIRPPHDAPTLFKKLEQVRGSQLAYVGEVRHWNRRHALFDVEVTVSSIQFRGHQCFLTLVTDVSHRKQAERALRDSEMQYRALFERAPDPMVLVDPKTLQVVDGNPEAARRLGYTREEFARLKVSDLEAAETPEKPRHRCARIVGDHVEVFETKQRTRSGKILDVSVHVRPIRLGDRDLLLGVWRDVTALRLAHAKLHRLNETLEARVMRRTAELTETNHRLKAITDSALVGILTLNVLGRVETANPEAARIFGYALDEMRGCDADSLMAPLADAAPSSLSVQRPRNLFSHRLVQGIRKDGATITLEISVSGFTHAGAPKQVVVLRDISERKKLERELLEAAERERQQLGHDLHDGLAQHLHALYYLADLLERDLAGDSPRRSAEAGRLAAELDRALELARGLARGLQPVEALPEGLSRALRELCSRTRKLYGVDCRFISRRPVLVEEHATANHLFRIAQEALNNAVKHGQPTRVYISLTAQEDRLALTVRDNGTGIQDPPCPGQGMGLHIMQYRAEAIQGALSVRHQPQGGTEVRCTLTRPHFSTHCTSKG